MEIRTNNVPRDIIDGYELSQDERREFEYIDWEAVERGEASPSFFRYKGTTYDLGEFMAATGMPADNPLTDWDGFLSDSYFSAIVVRYADDYERVVVGLALS